MDYGTITYSSKDEPEEEFVLRIGSITLGRSGENDVVFEDDSVGRFHLRLLCTADSCWATDLNSANGTFLNQVRLQPNMRQPLRDGDIIKVGIYTVRYHRPVLKRMLPPEVAAKLPIVVSQPQSVGLSPTVRRLRGNAPPRFQRHLLGDYEISTYMQYLPPCYQDDIFMGRFLIIFESILDPLERMIDRVDHYLDPRLAPEPLLPWLASWVDLVLNEKWPLERRRALIRSAAELYRWRGTRRGLTEYIKIYTGVEPTIIEPGPPDNNPSGLPPHVFKVVIGVRDPSLVDRDLLEAIIQAEKPAHTAYEIEIKQITEAAA